MKRFAMLARNLAFASVLIGCGKSATAPLESVQRERWRAVATTSYQYVSSYSCECLPAFAGPLRITVQNNVVTAVVNVATGASVPLGYRTSIEGLFDLIDAERRTRPSLLEVTYHASMGYPTRIKYGTPENDGGGVIVITSVTLGN